MPKFRRTKYLTSILVCFTLILNFSAEALAAGHRHSMEGCAAASGTTLDRSSYVDGSIYENPPTDVKTVRIGIQFGPRAPIISRFINNNCEGFHIGYYDDERNFHVLESTSASDLTVSAGTEYALWHIMLSEVFTDKEKAENTAQYYGGFTKEINGEYRVLYGNYYSREEADYIVNKYRPAGSPYTFDKGKLRITDSSNFEPIYTAPDEQTAVAIVPICSSGKGTTKHGADVYYGGFECVFADGHLNVINCVDLEDYVKGVIPYEMSWAWPYEALKAQAVCARTYVVYNQNSFEEYNFDLKNNTESQVYRGILEANETTDSAVDETAGQLIRYEGEICEIYYSAANGGASEDGKHVFDTDRPYLAGKPDPFEQAVDFSLKTWEKWYDSEDLAWLLQIKGYDVGPVVLVEPEHSEVGNVIALSFTDKFGNCVRIEGRACYTTLKLNCCRFQIWQDGESFGFIGGGLGHSCGMSQWGAHAMASVYGYDYEDIIRFYFTGAYIA